MHSSPHLLSSASFIFIFTLVTVNCPQNLASVQCQCSVVGRYSEAGVYPLPDQSVKLHNPDMYGHFENYPPVNCIYFFSLKFQIELIPMYAHSVAMLQTFRQFQSLVVCWPPVVEVITSLQWCDDLQCFFNPHSTVSCAYRPTATRVNGIWL